MMSSCMTKLEFPPEPYILFGLGKLPHIMGTGIPIFRQVVVTIVVAKNDTPIRLQIKSLNPTILAPQLL